MANRRNRTIVVGLGTAFLLLLGGIRAESQLLSPCAPTYPDEVSDSSNCASPLDVRSKDELDWPTDVDWYTAYNPGPEDWSAPAHFIVTPSIGSIRCTVFHKSPEGLVELSQDTPAPGYPCQNSFAAHPYHTYYLRISVAGPYLPGMKYQLISVSISWGGPCDIIYPDDVSNSRTCATNVLIRAQDELNWEDDHDWYYFINDGAYHPTASYRVQARSTRIKCSVYKNAGATAVGSMTADSGICIVVFVAEGHNKYYLVLEQAEFPAPASMPYETLYVIASI